MRADLAALLILAPFLSWLPPCLGISASAFLLLVGIIEQRFYEETGILPSSSFIRSGAAAITRQTFR